MTVSLDLDTLDFSKGQGLVTVVTQDAHTGVVLMVAHADREALEYTLRTGEMHYRSRSRGLWHKGGTSGNVQRVVTLTADCDRDAVLARVIPAGPACHEGTTSCFRDDRAQSLLAAGEKPSYTQRLLTDRNLRLKKLGEEAVELTMACVDHDTARAAEETADLVYHALVALHAVGGTLDDVRAVLAGRVR
jgi:phosphoribosyl-ATP pyrophosphohydrolase/phosphoribosyl-AMP cyclohydrolase